MKKNTPNSANRMNPSDRAWKLAQLAAAMVNKVTVVGDKDKADNYGHMVALNIAVRQANYLLAAAECLSHTRHAYQLFNSDWYTIHKAEQIFKAHSWPKLQSWNSVQQLFDEILKRLRELAQPLSPDSAAAELGLNYPKVIPPQNALFWPDPSTLKSPQAGANCKAGKRGKPVFVYQARAILLAAHTYLRDEFRDRIECCGETC